MRFSHRAQSIAPFFVMEFAKRAAMLEAQGHHIVKLSIGEPDFGAPPSVLAALKTAAEDGALAYTPAVGLPALRQAIAGFYRQMHGLDIDPARIVVTAGASAALLLVAACLVDPGDTVLMGDPCYPCNLQFFRGFGASVTLAPTSAASRFLLDRASVAAHWNDETRGVVIATPSNPTGTSLPIEELQAICDWVRAQGGWRVIDEIYLNLSDPDADGQAPRSVLSVDPDAIVINSFSKYFGMTGWRLGWCVVPDEMVPIIERLAQNYYICPSTVAQKAALQCFTSQALAVCEERRAELAIRRQLVIAGLEKIGLPVPVRPSGAFYVYFDVRNTGLPAMAFCERALEEAHVALTPGNDFGASGGDQHVRLSYAASREALRIGLERLGQFMHTLRGENA